MGRIGGAQYHPSSTGRKDAIKFLSSGRDKCGLDLRRRSMEKLIIEQMVERNCVNAHYYCESCKNEIYCFSCSTDTYQLPTTCYQDTV